MSAARDVWYEIWCIGRRPTLAWTGDDRREAKRRARSWAQLSGDYRIVKCTRERIATVFHKEEKAT